MRLERVKSPSSRSKELSYKEARERVQQRARIHPCAPIRVCVYSVALYLAQVKRKRAQQHRRMLCKTFVHVCVRANVPDAQSTSFQLLYQDTIVF